MQFDMIPRYAIEQEVKTAALYESLIDKVKVRSAKQALETLQDMELEHKATLENKDFTQFIAQNPAAIQDLKLSDYMTEPELTNMMDIQNVLILAAKNEARARDMYLDLAKRTSDDPLTTEMFTILAEQESKHKLMIENELESAYFQEM